MCVFMCDQDIAVSPSETGMARIYHSQSWSDLANSCARDLVLWTDRDCEFDSYHVFFLVLSLTFHLS